MTERDDLIESLQRQRFFLTNTLRGLPDEQARSRPTVSELSLGGLIKHVASVEARWANFIEQGPSAMGSADDPDRAAAFAATFVMTEDDTVAGLLADYEAVARRTDDLVATLPDLGAEQPLPRAPWFKPGASWSARRVLLHVLGEISQHAGHADILRESIDGAKSMG